jgi:hypothetical protein
MSLKDIAAAAEVSVSTAWRYTTDLPQPSRDLWRPPARRTKGALSYARLADVDAAREWALERLPSVQADILRAAGTALYVGEGSKTPGSVKLVNTNPDVVAFFLRWLRAEFVIDECRLRGHLYLHEDLDLGQAVAFWVGVTGIPADQFIKPYRAVANPTRRLRRHENGCLAVSYHCAWTQRRVLALCDALLSWSGTDPA